MRECLEKVGATGNEPEQPRDVDAGNLAVEGMVDVFVGFWIDKIQARLAAFVTNLDVGIVAFVDVMVDALEEVLDVIVQICKRLLDGRKQDRQVELLENGVLVPPARIADQVVFEAAKFVAVGAEDVTRFERIARQPVDEKLVAVGVDPFCVAVDRNKFVTVATLKVSLATMRFFKHCGILAGQAFRLAN